MTVEGFRKDKHIKPGVLCKILGIPRSSYYKWLKRKIPDKEKQDRELATLIREYQAAYRGILGYRRMTIYINRFNQTHYSEKYIHRLMQYTKMQARIRRKKYHYVKTKPEQVGENILNRDFKATAPNQKWCTDVTEFSIIGHKRKLYLSAVLDLYDKSIISYVLSNANNNKLVFDTFDLALKKNPGAKPIFHSDRGFQYTSKQFKFKLDQAGMIQSMSRVGKCIDNGPMEGFWGTLKCEMFKGIKYKNECELRKAIVKYINFYNNSRYQKRLKNMAPNEYRSHAFA